MTKTNTNKTWRLGAVALAVVAVLATGPAFAQDFSRYLALGDSLTAGFISGSLGERGQRNSYPAIFGRQIGAGEIEQPLVSDPGIPARLTLKSLAPLTITPEAGSGAPINLMSPGYNNLGIPGADVDEVLTVLTDNGGLFDLILRGLGFTALQQGLAQQPTFTSIWLGANDVLAAATSGMVIEGVTITPAAEFESDYRTIVTSVAGVGSQMVLVTVPSVTAIPFVSTLPPVLVDPATSQPVLVGGQPVPLLGPDGPLSSADKVLLPASVLLAQGIGIPAAAGGTGSPLPDQVVLSAGEVATIEARTAFFNNVIRTVAAETGSALLDAAAIFDEIVAGGFTVGGATYDASLFGGIFSYDGVHPSPLGYAIVANEMIAAVNDHFGSSVPFASLAPFVSGGAGNIGGATDLVLGQPLMTRKATKSLRSALGVPKIKKLKRIKRRRARQAAAAGATATSVTSVGTRSVAVRQVEGGRAVSIRRVDG